MSTTFVNEKRICGTTIEGHGEYQTRWHDYEIKCIECGQWSKSYGEISQQVGDDPNVHAWLCGACAAKIDTSEFVPGVESH